MGNSWLAKGVPARVEEGEGPRWSLSGWGGLPYGGTAQQWVLSPSSMRMFSAQMRGRPASYVLSCPGLGPWGAGRVKGLCILSKAHTWQHQRVGDKKGRHGATDRGDVDGHHLWPLDSGAQVLSSAQHIAPSMTRRPQTAQTMGLVPRLSVGINTNAETRRCQSWSGTLRCRPISIPPQGPTSRLWSATLALWFLLPIPGLQ